MKIDDAESAQPVQLWREFNMIWERMPDGSLSMNAYAGDTVASSSSMLVDGTYWPVTAPECPPCSCGNDKLGPGPYHLTTCEQWRAGK